MRRGFDRDFGVEGVGLGLGAVAGHDCVLLCVTVDGNMFLALPFSTLALLKVYIYMFDDNEDRVTLLFTFIPSHRHQITRRESLRQISIAH